MESSKTVERMNPGVPDSVEKLVTFLASLTEEDVRFGPKQKLVGPEVVDQISIGPSMYRSFKCPDTCFACCAVKITLDFLPDEENLPDVFAERVVDINGEVFPVQSFYTGKQDRCQFLKDNVCQLWPDPPLECCKAPQLGVRQFRPGRTHFIKAPYGRAWIWKITPECEFGERDKDVDLSREIELLHYYQEWADYLKIPAKLDVLINGLKEGSEGVVWERT